MLREDTSYLMKAVERKWRVERVGKGKYWGRGDDDPELECYEVRTTGCGCCSETIQTLDKALALKVAQTQVEIWQAVVEELEKVV